MNRKTCLLLLVAIHCVLASDHSLVKRQTSDTTNTGMRRSEHFNRKTRHPIPQCLDTS